MGKLDVLKAKIAVAEAELKLASARAAAVVDDVFAVVSGVIAPVSEEYGGQNRYGSPRQDEKGKERHEQLKEDHAAWMNGEGA